jgi:hypothetical protein
MHLHKGTSCLNWLFMLSRSLFRMLFNCQQFLFSAVVVVVGRRDWSMESDNTRQGRSFSLDSVSFLLGNNTKFGNERKKKATF